MTPWIALLGAVTCIGLIATFSAGYLLQTACMAALLGLVAIVLMRKCGLWDSRTLFFAVSCLYVMAGPVDVVLVREPSELDADASFAAMRLGLLFQLASLVPMFVAGPLAPVSPAARRLPISWRAAAALAAFGVILFLAAVAAGPGLDVGGMTRAEVVSAQAWHFAILRFGLYLLFLYVAICLGPGRAATQPVPPAVVAILLASLAVFLLIELLVLGDRRMFVMTVMGAAVALYPRQTRFGHLGFGLAVGAMLLLYSLVRNQPVDNWIDIIASADLTMAVAPRNVEFGAYAMVADTLLSDFVPDEFPTYLQALPQLVPGFVLESRPEAPSQWFARTYFPEIAAEGGAFAFNFVVEAYLNAGLAGVLAAGGVVGLALRFAVTSRYRPVLNPLAAMMFVFLLRLDLVSVLRNLIITAVGFVCLYALFSLLTRRLAAGTAPR
jgi:hypothetical protein